MTKQSLSLSRSLAVVVAAGSCRNPLSIGLGDDIDLETPSLAVTSHANGAYVNGSIDLEGTYADDFADVTVRVSLDNGLTFGQADVDQAARHWSYTIDTTAHPDGGYDVIITVDGQRRQNHREADPPLLRQHAARGPGQGSPGIRVSAQRVQRDRLHPRRRLRPVPCTAGRGGRLQRFRDPAGIVDRRHRDQQLEPTTSRASASSAASRTAT